ncbi:hypothetical protein pdam_00020583, partial [Pocillopora damicornis]
MPQQHILIRWYLHKEKETLCGCQHGALPVLVAFIKKELYLHRGVNVEVTSSITKGKVVANQFRLGSVISSLITSHPAFISGITKTSCKNFFLNMHQVAIESAIKRSSLTDPNPKTDALKNDKTLQHCMRREQLQHKPEVTFHGARRLQLKRQMGQDITCSDQSLGEWQAIFYVAQPKN